MGSKYGTITAITLTDNDPVLITDADHGLVTGDVIRDIAGVVGTEDLTTYTLMVEVYMQPEV